MISRNAIVCALVAAAGTTASGGVFSWTGASSDSWLDPGNWIGPGGQVPSTISDTATLAVDTGEVPIGANLVLAELNILNGVYVLSGNHSVFVAGDIFIQGVGSSLSTTPSPALRDLDVDTLTIDGGIHAIYGGLAQIDEALIIEGGGAVLGSGTIEMNSTTGNIELQSGSIWAAGGNNPDPTLRLTRTQSSTSKLDWSSPNAHITVWDGKTFINELPYIGALGGELFIAGSEEMSTFESADAFVTGANSVIRFYGVGQGGDAVIEAPAVDVYGEIRVFGEGELDAPLVALRGHGTINEDGKFSVPAGALILDSFGFAATGPNAEVEFAVIGGATSVFGGETVFDLGETGSFDLDGAGTREITVADGSSLRILAGLIDTAGSEIFHGTLNVAGTFHTENYGPQQGAWRTDGDINMQNGTITGRRFGNNGTITGRGLVDTRVHNDGLIEAVGGTLMFADLDPGGTVEIPGAGVVRAEQGDIVVADTDLGGFLPTSSSIFVGDGAAIREVFEMNGGLLLSVHGDESGLLSMDSGFARFGRLRVRSAFQSVGDSIVTISGASEFDAFELVDGTASINGSLEVRGNAVIWDDAQVTGGGVIDAASTVKSIAMRDGADTGAVSIAASGAVEIGAYGEDAAQAQTAGLMMQPTARLAIDIAGDTASGAFDSLTVTGDAAIDGTIEVRWSADLGDAPVGETYTVLSADSVQGGFDAVDFTGLGTNRRAVVTVNPDSVEVLVTCLTDVNGDGLLDLSDITSFVDAFTQGDMLADVAPPFDLLDLSDINAFVFFFQGGCN